MIPIYHFYTLWVIFLSLFEKITRVSMFPNLVVALVTSTLLALKYQLKMPLLAFNIIIHSTPLLWSKLNLTIPTLIANIAIGFLYFIFIKLKREDIATIYHTQFEYLRKTPSLEKLLETHANVCVFC